MTADMNDFMIYINKAGHEDILLSETLSLKFVGIGV
jgi:hypothetical protein